MQNMQNAQNLLYAHNVLFDFLSKYISLSEEEKNTLQSLDIIQNVKKNTILLHAGKHSQMSYFVLKGYLRVYYVIDGEEKTTAFYTEMESLTPFCVLSKEPSEYYVVCGEDSVLLMPHPDMEVEILKKFPKFESLCKVLSEQLVIKQQNTFDEFKIHTPEQRYLSLLKNRPELTQRVPQHQLASYLGITPPSLSRLRARITKKEQKN
jgi:CRP-like cAMP-binding protein